MYKHRWNESTIGDRSTTAFDHDNLSNPRSPGVDLANETAKKCQTVANVLDSYVTENQRLKSQKQVLMSEIDDLSVDIRRLQSTCQEISAKDDLIRRENNNLSMKSRELELENLRLRNDKDRLTSTIDTLTLRPQSVVHCCPPCCTLSCCNPYSTICVPCVSCPTRCERIEWVIFNAATKFRSINRLSCLSSPSFKSSRLGVDRVEFEFYPNGAAGSSYKAGSLVVRAARGTHLTFQIFVGSKRSNTIGHTFSNWTMGGYRHDISRILDEIDWADDTLVIGIDIFSACKNGRTIFA